MGQGQAGGGERGLQLVGRGTWHGSLSWKGAETAWGWGLSPTLVRALWRSVAG